MSFLECMKCENIVNHHIKKGKLFLWDCKLWVMPWIIERCLINGYTYVVIKHQHLQYVACNNSNPIVPEE